MNKVLISVVGPTGIGKTKMAIALARYFNTEIISADSRQFYKEMSIGTAVPSQQELTAVPHHFIQHISIFAKYTVGDFERDAISLLDALFIEKDVAVLVGGSALYVDAVINGLDTFPKIDPKIRDQLNLQLAEEGIEPLNSQLKLLDPQYFDKVDLGNPHRVIRALEVCLGSGRPYTSFLAKKRPTRGFKAITVGITADRDVIYDRINNRVDLMMQQGLLEEAKKLLQHAHLNALQTVGYRELFTYLSGTHDLNSAISEIKKNTRRFAKRQLTWYRKREDILWIDYDCESKKAIELVDQSLKAL